MGYTTDFDGVFILGKPLAQEHKDYLTKFAETRRMKRWSAKAEARPDPVRLAAKLPIGVDGGYFVGAGELSGQERTEDVAEYNYPPSGQPGLWCQWLPTEDGRGITWDESEKFYYYREWLEYLIEHFLTPWGYKLSGEVRWQGEESSDHGTIYTENGRVELVRDIVKSPGPSWRK